MAFLCRRYKVSRSGFYAWQARDGSKQRRRNDEELGARIERIHCDSGARYGSPRVHQVLKREGIRCSNKRVARLMRERGLRARVSRLYRKGSGVVRRFFAKTGNLRHEEPLPTRADQIWVGDITYLRLGKRWRYLATVMDLFSRRIVGWTLSRNRTIEITHQDFLKTKGIVPSMNRPRHCQDNGHMESFFHSLKAELTHQRSYASDAQLNASVAGYINRFYNEKRIHSSLGYHSPVEFERLANA